MIKTATAPYDVAEHLRTREEMAAYLEASIEESDGDAAFVAKALGNIARAAWRRWRPMPGCPARASTKHFPESAFRRSRPSSEWSVRWD